MPKRITNFEKSNKLAERAHTLIPGACHTYSKGDDQFPLQSPRFIERGSGCRVFDLDGNEYLDWGMGLRSVLLGHGYPAVLEAVNYQLQNGTNFTRPAPIEVELAELLVNLVPSAQMVKFAKNGSTVTTAAVKLARAYTGRDYVALCRDHPFFSYDDWFIGTTPCSAGVPKAIQDLSLTFGYNDLDEIERLFARHPQGIAAVILEPATAVPPASGYLAGLRELCTRHGTVLIFDEMITGFRWHLSGAQAYFDVTPDLSTFGKGMGNGFSVAALVGKREIMELGGIRHQKEKVFLISTTHGAETHSLAAALATITELRDKQVIGHLWRVGGALVEGFNALSGELGLTQHAKASGYPCSPVFTFYDRSGAVSSPLRTLFLQEMIARGVLIPYISPSFTHRDREVDETLAATRHALSVCRQALDENAIEKHLVGPPTKPVFRKYN
jgi:glutamate-1-semialdehyde 2,1-aminomutase